MCQKSFVCVVREVKEMIDYSIEFSAVEWVYDG